MHPVNKQIPSRTSHALTLLLTSPWAMAWQRTYRQTFGLVDGHRDTHRIALLLHKPEPLINHVVEELTVAGYVSLQTQRKVVRMNSALLKASFELIVPQKEAFAHSFYQRLFSDYPQTRPLFAHTQMKRQEGSLIATLAIVVAGVQRGDNLAPILRQLGARHQRYGAQAQHYPLVGAVLLETFLEYLGPAFTPAMQEAWEQAFELISAQMLQGEELVASSQVSEGAVPLDQGQISSPGPEGVNLQ